MTERIEIYILSQLQFHFIFSKGKALAGAISSVFSGRIRVRGALPRSPPVTPLPWHRAAWAPPARHGERCCRFILHSSPERFEDAARAAWVIAEEISAAELFFQRCTQILCNVSVSTVYKCINIKDKHPLAFHGKDGNSGRRKINIFRI